jgi:hypothetical protein
VQRQEQELLQELLPSEPVQPSVRELLRVPELRLLHPLPR